MQVTKDNGCVHLVVEAVVDFHLSPETRQRRRQARPQPRLCQRSPGSHRPTPHRTPLHPPPTHPACYQPQCQGPNSSGCPHTAASDGSQLVTLAESPEETLMGVPVLPPEDSPEHYLPMHKGASSQSSGHPSGSNPPWPTHSAPAAGARGAAVQSTGYPSAAAGAPSGYRLLQPTPVGLQQGSPPANRVGFKRRVLSPDAAGMSRLTLGRAQKRLRLEGSDGGPSQQPTPVANAPTHSAAAIPLEQEANLGLAWQPMSAGKPPLAPAAAVGLVRSVGPGNGDRSGTGDDLTPTGSPSKGSGCLPQHIRDSLKQIRKRRVSLRLKAQVGARQTRPALPPRSEPGVTSNSNGQLGQVTQGTAAPPANTSGSMGPTNSPLTWGIPLQPEHHHDATIMHPHPMHSSVTSSSESARSSDGSAKSKVSDEMAQSPHARGGVRLQSPACGLAQQNGAGGCLYSALVDISRPTPGVQPDSGGARGEVPASGCHILGKRPVPGQCVFRSQKRLRF